MTTDTTRRNVSLVLIALVMLSCVALMTLAFGITVSQ